MIIKSLILCSFIYATCNLNAQNLITNPGFEDDTAGNIDYWRERDAIAAGADTTTYIEGSQSAKFDSTVAGTSYYYANYNLDGTTENWPAVESDVMYEFSIKYKTEASSGIYLQMCFYKGDESIGMYETTIKSSTTWATLKLNGMARKGADKVQVGIYYKSSSSTNDCAWIDDALLIKKIQLCRNGSSEIDAVIPVDIPDYWHPRGGTYTQYHHVETSFLDTYLGNNAMLFDSPSISNQIYLYGPYDADGTNRQQISVCPGDSYTISCFSRADSSFSGSGFYVSLLFWNGTSYVDRSNSSYSSPDVWTKKTYDAVVPAGVDNISYSIEYNGQNEIWVDEVKVVQKNLVTNSSFETDGTSPVDEPDYWNARLGTTNQYHHVDTTLGYNGSNCAQFDNTTTSDEEGYFYGPSDADGTRADIDVIPGEVYTFSTWAKVESSFTGPGLRISIMFFNDGTYVSRVNSSRTKPTSWTKKTVTATVPSTGVNELRYSVEFYGQNSAWFDAAYLSKTNPWYYTEVSSSSLVSLSFTSPSKYTGLLDKFDDQHDIYEARYMESGNPAGTWGVGYGTVSNNHPLVRFSANAALAYLHAYSKISNSDYKTRAKAALDWLLTQQNLDVYSDQYGAFPWWGSTTPTYSGGGEMYEGGLAGLALIKGYDFFRTEDATAAANYLAASNRLCDYFISIDPSVNANFNAFAVMALAANYKTTENEDYLDQALYFMDTVISFQLDSGMWGDGHNQYIYYHGIITRALVRLMYALPDSHPKKEVIKHSIYKALNHIRQSQSYATNSTSGVLVRHPLRTDPEYHCTLTLTAVSEAYALLNMPISDSLDTLTKTAEAVGTEVVQGHTFASLGILLDSYY